MNPIPPSAILFTIAETAKVLKLCTRSVVNLINRKALAPTRIGRSVRISQSSIEEFIKRHTSNSNPK